MIEAVERLVKLLESENVEWEVFYQFGRSGSFRIERETLERSQRKFYSGIGLRVGLKGRLGFSYITGLHPSEEELKKLVERAVKLAKISEVPFRGFPTKEKVSNVEGIYDREIDEIPFEDAHRLALEYAELMREKKGEETLSGSLSLAVGTSGVVNSNGIELEERSTYMGVSAYAVLSEPPGTGSYRQSFTSLQPVEELERAVEKAIDEARLSARARKLEPYSGELVLEPNALASIMEVFLSNLYGDEVYHGRSRFSKPGDVIGSFTLVDDSTLPELPGSYSFDGEGSPGQRTVLVGDGIVRNFLLDRTYASFLGMESTGNALRTFRSVPYIGTSNLILEPGDESLEDYEGVVVRKVFGEHTANPVSGDFSLTVELGYVVENGELKPFKDNMLVGNVFELLRTLKPGKEVERISSFLSPRAIVEGRLV
ncbi:TldE/PmbA protein, part of proposed TldE/TldD proteolytic complex (PMID 12029038) [Thermococcus nautili]|uniref:TldD/PmbA family protein n=1 Tax=Thermococcus nautili TaxID=195522 RepID=UPI0025535D79|nr:TldD/PmbA family protein [Thermococcus nautili]CAI1492900.1 TldE/PmbA protein, part of proposed TldE/TldD proteolytic complex (PMID 12029038) [Thermococcus nautili]